MYANNLESVCEADEQGSYIVSLVDPARNCDDHKSDKNKVRGFQCDIEDSDNSSVKEENFKNILLTDENRSTIAHAIYLPDLVNDKIIKDMEDPEDGIEGSNQGFKGSFYYEIQKLNMY